MGEIVWLNYIKQFHLAYFASAAALLRSSTESFPSLGNSQSGKSLTNASTTNDVKPIAIAIAH